MLPAAVSTALKEWAVTIRALREGRQVMLLRKGGIYDAGGEFSVEARDVALFPTYLHEDEQKDALQPCYGAWLAEENRRRPPGEVIRIEAVARITGIVRVESDAALFALRSQHIYSDAFLCTRWEMQPDRPLCAVFVRAFELPAPVTIALEPEHYGCRSWVVLRAPIATAGATPVLTDRTFEARVRVTRRLLTTKEN